MIKVLINHITFHLTILKLRIAGATDAQVYMEKGGYYLRKGAEIKVGDRINTPIPGSNKTRSRYISNLLFNFKTNKIVAAYSNKPIKGISETIYE